MTTPAVGGVFHDGESAVQERAGVREKMARVGGRMIRDFMPDQHRIFFENQPFVVVGSLDAEKRPWASIAFGAPGFASAPNPSVLVVDGTIAAGDPLARNLRKDGPVGILGIQPETRRRNRANGTVVDVDGDAFAVHVTQSFGNCPKYIQARAPEFRRDPATKVDGASPEGRLLSPAAADVVRRADTFFIASASRNAEGTGPGDGVDVSHRGGRPGFVAVADEAGRTVLTFPDYEGNYLFNTLGNIQANPRVGLVFPEFETGDVLTLTGEAEIVWDGPEVDAARGAQRLVRVRVTEGVLLRDALPFRWSKAELAPEFDDPAA